MEITRYIAELPAIPVKELTATVNVEVPLSWWDHFKDTFYPSWLTYFFPVSKAVYSDSVTIRRDAVLTEDIAELLGKHRIVYADTKIN